MQKQKLTKFKAKLVIALFIINMVCIFGFGSSSLATSPLNLQLDIDWKYFATYDFYDDAIGAIGEDISFIDNYGAGGTSSISVVDSYEGHTNILLLDDNGHHEYPYMEHNLEGGAQSDEIVEFYYAPSTMGIFAATHFYTFESENKLIHLRMGWSNGDLDYNAGGQWNTVVNGLFSSGKWYHFKIKANDTSNTFDIYIDNIITGTNLPYETESEIGADKIAFSTEYGEDLESYIDAIGLPNRDPNYDVGDNNPYIIEGDSLTINWNP